MSDIVIKADNLSKRYRIGLEEETHDTLIGQLIHWLRSPLHNLRQLRQLTSFADNSRNSDTSIDTVWAIKDISFEVRRGEVVGIIGRNGAGKSTLLKILSRITHPSRGRVELNGRISSLLEVGTGFHSELTGRENIYLNGTILGMTKTEVDHKFDKIVDFSGIEKFIDTPVKRYSSGMSVRLAFSVAAHLEPEILLVDEVLAVGDVEFQKKCLGKMDEVAKGGRTVLFVSHNMMAVEGLCQRAIMIERGKIVGDGPTREVIDKYLSYFTQSKSESNWKTMEASPGNEHVRIQRISILSMNGKPPVQISMRDPVIITVDFWNLLDSADLYPNIRIRSSDDITIFANAPVQQPNWKKKKLRKGLFRSICVIPGDLLNTGTYFLDVRMVKKGKLIYSYPERFSFDVQNSLDRIGYMYNRAEGCIRPLLHWTIEPLIDSKQHK